MDVQVKDCLPAMRTGVCDQAVPTCGNPFLLGKFACHAEDVSYHLLVLRLHHPHRIDVPVRDDQDMRGRHRVDIAESSDLFILVNNGRFAFV